MIFLLFCHLISHFLFLCFQFMCISCFLLLFFSSFSISIRTPTHEHKHTHTHTPVPTIPAAYPPTRPPTLTNSSPYYLSSPSSPPPPLPFSLPFFPSPSPIPSPPNLGRALNHLHTPDPCNGNRGATLAALRTDKFCKPCNKTV